MTSREFGELAAAFSTVTQQLQAKAREQRRIRETLADERGLVDSVLETAGSLILVAVLDRDGRIVHFNRACESTMGYSFAEVEGRLVSELFLAPEDLEYAAAFGELAAPAEGYPFPSSFVCSWIDRDSRRHDIAWSNDASVDSQGGTRVIATGVDITDRRTAEAELQEADERFELAFESAPIGMCLVRQDGRFVQVNRALCELLGRSESEVLSLGLTEITHFGDRQTTLQSIANMGRSRTHAHHDEIRFLHGSGRIVWTLMSVSAVPRNGGEPLYYLIQVQDITARRAAEDRLAQQALHDPLTGLLNRPALMEQAQLELKRGHHRDGLTGLLCADLDGFKMINESLGGFVGDQVLREVARRLQAGAGSSATVARFGGDEFVILCRELHDRSDLLNLARRLVDSVSAPIIVDGREITVTVSVGLASDESGEMNADHLVRNAGVAMYRAKASGRNECRMFEESFRQYLTDWARIEDGLRQGLRGDHFTLHFQPIVDLRTHRVRGVESLLRLNHPKLGMMMPGTFIPIAEESGLIVPVGAWVLQQACRELASWRDEYGPAYDPLTVAVNVSAHQVARPDLAETVAGALAESSLPPDALVLELTESMLMSVDVNVLRGLERIRDMGVRLGIDDFGTGYSSFLYLRRLPVSFIKIDRSFVSGLAPSPRDREIVTAIVRLGRALGLTTIAEGVENPEQLAALREIGCDLAQGYHFGRAEPGPPDLVRPAMGFVGAS